MGAHDDAASATTYFKDWHRRVIHSKLAPMKKLVTTIKERIENVVSCCTHGITNAVAEGICSKKHVDQTPRRWLSKPRTLQDRDLLPLWRLGSLLTMNPNGPFSFGFESRVEYLQTLIGTDGDYRWRKAD